jgi:hypothetical protein
VDEQDGARSIGPSHVQAHRATADATVIATQLSECDWIEANNTLAPPMQFVPLLAALLTSGAALADNTDIKIHVEYTTSAFRLRPKPGPERATTTLDIVLHPDGKVEDRFSEHGSHARKYSSRDGKLGENKASLTQYRVVDESTVLRTFDDGVLAGSTKIEVKGQGGKRQWSSL